MPSRKASTSLAVISGAGCTGIVAPVDALLVGAGFGTCDQAERQESASTYNKFAARQAVKGLIFVILMTGRDCAPPLPAISPGLQSSAEAEFFSTFRRAASSRLAEGSSHIRRLT